MFRLFKSSIRIKLSLWILFSMFTIFAMATVVNILFQNELAVKKEASAAKKFSAAILTAIRYPMMTGDQDIIQLQFDRFKDLEGLETLHLLDHNGIVKRSSDRTLIGQQSLAEFLDKALLGEEFSGVERRIRSKHTIFSELYPILNEQKCYTCHGSTQKVLGVLRIASDWNPVLAVIRYNILISLAGLIIMSFVIYSLLKNMVIKPLNILAKGTIPLAAGDLTQKIKISTQDEFGSLADSFNKIVDSMHDMLSQVRGNADKVAVSSEQVSSIAQEMNASAQEISNAVNQVNKGVVIQAERVEETFEIMEKSAVSLKQMVANAQTGSQAIETTSDRASEGGIATAKETTQKIEQLTNTVLETTKAILGLGQMSKQIGEITETITSIADQTNLLALNAAIEAARAGEAGRGFAVVAEEVRKLAEGSAEAVKKIGGLIKSIQSETNRAVSAIQASSKEVQEGKILVSKISVTFAEINSVAHDASNLAQMIAVTGQERVEEVERVVKAINDIAVITKESASTTQVITASTEEQTSSMEEMAASAQELARLAVDLKEMVGKFKLREAAF